MQHFQLALIDSTPCALSKAESKYHLSNKAIFLYVYDPVLVSIWMHQWAALQWCFHQFVLKRAEKRLDRLGTNGYFCHLFFLLIAISTLPKTPVAKETALQDSALCSSPHRQ